MKKLVIGLIVVVLLIELIFVFNMEGGFEESSADIQKIYLNEEIFDLEVVRTREDMTRGLMFRESLDRDKGMIFVYEDEAKRSFWMKNTKISLDMIFIDSLGKIVEIKENVQPCEVEDCQSYVSLPAKYVIEVNGGVVRDIGLGVGDIVDLMEM